MKKDIHPKAQEVEFHCLSCSTSKKILSTHKEKKVNINICSNCHPFYQGKSNLERGIGKAERLRSRFALGKERAQSKNK